MKEELEFVGDPTLYNDDDWRQLAQAVVGYGEVTVSFVVDLPPLGQGNYDLRVSAMTSALRMHLNRLIESTVLVAEATRTGGLRAHVGYDISLIEDDNNE